MKPIPCPLDDRSQSLKHDNRRTLATSKLRLFTPEPKLVLSGAIVGLELTIIVIHKLHSFLSSRGI